MGLQFASISDSLSSESEMAAISVSFLPSIVCVVEEEVEGEDEDG